MIMWICLLIISYVAIFQLGYTIGETQGKKFRLTFLELLETKIDKAKRQLEAELRKNLFIDK